MSCFPVYVPYCSSDLHSGTRNASTQTNGRVFYGKYIIEAVLVVKLKLKFNMCVTGGVNGEWYDYD